MSFDDEYVREYFRRLTTENSVEPPDINRLNGHRELAEALYMAYQMGGAEAARQALETQKKSDQQLDQLLNPSPTTRRILTVAEVKNRPQIKWLVPGMIPERGLVEMHGAPSSGKSLLALDLAAQVAQTYPVLYVVTEGLDRLGERITAWELAHQQSMSSQLRFDDSPVYLQNHENVLAFIQDAKLYAPKLIVLDTLARCTVSGDENSVKDMTVAMEACSEMIRAMDTAVLIIHHTGKTGVEPRGSSVLPSDFDAMFLVKKNGTRVMVQAQKMRDGTAIEEYNMHIKEFGNSVALVPFLEANSETNEKQAKATYTQILEQLWANPNGIAFKDLMALTGIAESSLRRHLDNLKKEKEIEQPQTRGPYYLTEKGKALLNPSSVEPSTTATTTTLL